MAQYLDESGLKVLWSKIKNTFTTKTEFSTLDTTFAEVVQELPTSGIKRHLYLKAVNSTGGNIYTEYLYTGNLPIQTSATASDYSTNKYDASKWEKLGEYKAEVDLSGYLKTADAANTYATKSFSKIAVGTTTVEADSKTDTLTLAGSNVTLTPDTTNDKVTIGITKTNVTTALGYTPPTSNDNWVHAVCRTASATAAKLATHTLYKLQAGNVFILTLELANTCQGQITLDVNSTGAKTVHLNGVATSSTNYSIPAGTYLVYYDGTNYHIRTDEVQPVTALKANMATSATSATMATKLGSATIGGTTTPIYLNGGTPTALGYTIAKSVPSNAVFTDTHYASSTAVAASAGAVSTTTSALTNGNVYLNHVENGQIKSSHKISGAGATTVTADASGNIIVTSTNTTYSAATTSANGLMSAADKTKLNGIATSATADSAIPTATIEALS